MSDLNKLSPNDFERYLYDALGVHLPSPGDDVVLTTELFDQVEPVRPSEVMRMLGTTQAGLVTMVSKKWVPPPRRMGYGRVAWQKCDLTKVSSAK